MFQGGGSLCDREIAHVKVVSNTSIASNRLLQHKCEKCRKKELLQRRSAEQIRPYTIPPIVNEALNSPGQPLDLGVRTFFEPRFGHDFNKVRIHTDAKAAESARNVNALAYTMGSDIVFRAGQYSPENTDGKLLLAHELVHVVQQNGSIGLQRQLDDIKEEDVPSETAEKVEDIQEEPTDEATEKQAEESEIYPEEIGPLGEVEYISEDYSPEEEISEEEKISAVSADLSSHLSSDWVTPPNHVSEREADRISHAMVYGHDIKPNLQLETDLGQKRQIQRKIFWDDQNKLNWSDFKAKPTIGSRSNASTSSGFNISKITPKRSAEPYPPGYPTPCKYRGKDSTNFEALVSLDISREGLGVKAYMEPKNSWVKPNSKSNALLEHEQGHFDISHVIAYKTEFALIYWGIRKLGKAIKCGKIAALNAATKAWNVLNPTQSLNRISSSGFSKLNQAQNDYDTETNHGTKPSEQKEWLGNISADLPDYEVAWE
jgi:hypothetical protein